MQLPEDLRIEESEGTVLLGVVEGKHFFELLARRCEFSERKQTNSKSDGHPSAERALSSHS